MAKANNKAANKEPTTENKEEAKKVSEKKSAPPKPVVVIKAGALSTDVGPTVILGMSRSYEEEDKAKAILQQVESKRFDLLAITTQAIVKAAKADPSIDLSVTFDGEPKKMSVLNDQLGLALGFREVTKSKDGDGKEIEKIGYAKAVLKYFPSPKDDKKAKETIRKATLRSNFLHMLKKCAQAAHAIVDQDITIKKDTASGTLLLSGPTIQAKFGQDSVLLNDKITIGEGDDAKKLNEKPSFTAIAKMGAASAGKVLTTRKDSRVDTGAVDPETAVLSICDTVVKAIGKLKGPAGPKVVEALKSVQSAIDKALKT